MWWYCVWRLLFFGPSHLAITSLYIPAPLVIVHGYLALFKVDHGLINTLGRCAIEQAVAVRE
jgi:hypothetical protein